MPTKARALGFNLNIGFGVLGDAEGGALTGKRHFMGDSQFVTVVLVFTAGVAPDDVQWDLQEHTLDVGGTSQDLDIITDYYKKQEATLDNDEVWTKVSQAAASEVTGDGTSAEEQEIYAFDVHHSQLSDGFRYISVNCPDLGAAGGTKLATILYINSGLKMQRSPENLPACLRAL